MSVTASSSEFRFENDRGVSPSDTIENCNLVKQTIQRTGRFRRYYGDRIVLATDGIDRLYVCQIFEPRVSSSRQGLLEFNQNMCSNQPLLVVATKVNRKPFNDAVFKESIDSTLNGGA